MKKFSLPVKWTVWDKVGIEAETLEEAIKKFKDEIDEIPLGPYPEYIDGSYQLDDGGNGNESLEKTIQYLKLSGCVDVEEITGGSDELL